jgi:outer membrane protein assembly factor BamB
MLPPFQRYVALGLLSLGSSVVSLIAEDYPQWRGINRDGVLNESGLIQKLPEGELPRLWTVPVGPGYSGPTVSQGRVFLTDRGVSAEESDTERVLCFNAEDGSLIWSHEYQAKYNDAQYNIGYKAGPRAAVTIDDSKAYSIGAMGHLKCFEVLSGDLVWQRNLASEYAVKMPIWGITSAPLIFNELLIQIVGGTDSSCVVAFDKATGKEKWRALDELAGYSAPILVRQGDQDVVVCWTGQSVSGLNPVTGETFWRFPMEPRNMPIGVATPVVSGKHLFVSSFYDGSMLIELDLNHPEAKQVWRRIGQSEKNTDSLHCMISTPLIKGNHIYGVDSYGELRCLALETGDRIWEDTTAVPTARWATIHTLQDGNREIMLNDQGELLFTQLNPERFIETSRTKLLAPTLRQLPRRNGVTWAHPAIANGVIYARSDEELVAASLTHSK